MIFANWRRQSQGQTNLYLGKSVQGSIIASSSDMKQNSWVEKLRLVVWYEHETFEAIKKSESLKIVSGQRTRMQPLKSQFTPFYIAYVAKV